MISQDEYQSVKETYKLLCALIDPKKTPNIPKSLREQAKKCLKHYPVRESQRRILEGLDFFNPR